MREIEHVEKPVCEHAKRRGFRVRKLQWVGRRGAPDRLFFGHGLFFFVEFKAPGKRPEDHQTREIDVMRQNMMPVFIIDNEAEGVDLINRMYKLCKRADALARPIQPFEPEDASDLL